MAEKIYNKSDVISSITDVTIRSASAEEILILEIGTLDNFLSHKQAEDIRSEFVKNKTPIRQITNQSGLAPWTEEKFLAQNMEVRYVPTDDFKITTEILIFDDTVAMYRIEPDPFYEEICDVDFMRTMRQFFFALWQVGDALQLTSDGSTLTKQYIPFTYSHGAIPIVLYPAKDDGHIEKVFDRNDVGCLERYVDKIIDSQIDFYNDSDIILAYVWNQDDVPYCDIWKINQNRLSDDSGFLYDARIYKDIEQVTDMGVASGNTSIVLTAEEILLRDLVLKKGLSFAAAADRHKYHARFPAGYVPAENFYTA